MAAEDIGSLVVRIEANLKNFNSGVENVGKRIDKIGSGIKKLGGVIAGAFAVKAVVDFGKETVKAAQEQERAENRLNTLLKNVNGTTQEQIDGLKKLAVAQQNLTTIGDEVTIAGQSQLATFQLSADSIAKLTPAFQDLAVATYGANVSQEQMIQSGNLIGKVMQGQVGALSRVGVSFTEVQAEILKTGTETEKTAALIEVLNSNFGGLAQSTRMTTEGAIIAMNNAWGDMKEVLGSFLLPILGRIATWFSSKIPTIQAFAVSAFEKIREVITPIYETVMPLLQQGFQYFSDNVIPLFSANVGEVSNTILPLLIGAFKNLAEKVLPPLQRIFEVFITDILPSLSNAYMQWITNVYPIFVDAFNYIVNNVLPPVIQIIEYLATEIIPLLAAKFQEWIPVIIDIVKGLWDAIKIYIDLLVKAFEFAWPYIKDIVGNAINTISGVISGLLKLLRGVIDFVVGVFTGDWERAWSGVRDIFGGIWDSIKSIFKGAINALIAGINLFIRGINKIKVPDWVPGVGGKNINLPEIPKLATGTNFVPFDTMAFLHKGEAVVPAANNPSNPGASNPVGGGSINYAGLFDGATINIRSDNDAKLFAREIFNLQQSRSRSGGVVTT